MKYWLTATCAFDWPQHAPLLCIKWDPCARKGGGGQSLCLDLRLPVSGSFTACTVSHVHPFLMPLLGFRAWFHMSLSRGAPKLVLIIMHWKKKKKKVDWDRLNWSFGMNKITEKLIDFPCKGLVIEQTSIFVISLTTGVMFCSLSFAAHPTHDNALCCLG